ncbi:MAG: YkvA family protein [Pedococcus sp.]
MAMNRFGALRTIATAVRTAARPGSPGMGERLMSLPRLFRATFHGEYAGTSRGRLLMVLGAVAYVVSPIDLIPELALSVFGLADDAVVVSWIAATVVNETESFLAWERTTPSARPNGGASGGTGASGASETVTGHVVP